MFHIAALPQSKDIIIDEINRKERRDHKDSIFAIFALRFLKVMYCCAHFSISGPRRKQLNHKDTEARRSSLRLRVSVVNAFAPFGCGGAALGSLRLLSPRPATK
jgi:hypothetical protein